MKSSKYLYVFVSIGLLILGWIVWSRASSPAPILVTPPQTQNTMEVAPSNEIKITNIKELTRKSILILLGTVTPTTITFNMARNPIDITEPHTDIYIVGHVYTLNTVEIIKNDSPTEIISENQQICIINNEGTLGSKMLKNPKNIEEAKTQDDVFVLDTSKVYLMFLNQYPDTHKFSELATLASQNCYAGVGDPWIFDATNPEIVTVISSWPSAVEYFPPQSLPNIIYQIENPGTVLASPYPDPTNAQLQPTEGTPYP